MDVEAVLDRIYYLTGMRTQAEVAAFVGLGPTAVNSWKNNENIPRKHLKTISAAHGLDVRDLFVKSERHPKPGADPAHPVLQDEVLRGRTPYPTAQDVLDPYPLAREQGASAAYHRAADPHVHVPGCDDIRLRQSMLERMGRADRMEWMRWPGDAPEVRRGDRVLVDTDATTQNEDGLFVVQIGEDLRMAKFVRDGPDQPWRIFGRALEPDQAYEVLGRVVLLVREL